MWFDFIGLIVHACCILYLLSTWKVVQNSFLLNLKLLNSRWRKCCSYQVQQKNWPGKQACTPLKLARREVCLNSQILGFLSLIKYFSCAAIRIWYFCSESLVNSTQLSQILLFSFLIFQFLPYSLKKKAKNQQPPKKHNNSSTASISWLMSLLTSDLHGIWRRYEVLWLCKISLPTVTHLAWAGHVRPHSEVESAVRGDQNGFDRWESVSVWGEVELWLFVGIYGWESLDIHVCVFFCLFLSRVWFSVFWYIFDRFIFISDAVISPQITNVLKSCSLEWIWKLGLYYTILSHFIFILIYHFPSLALYLKSFLELSWGFAKWSHLPQCWEFSPWRCAMGLLPSVASVHSF